MMHDDDSTLAQRCWECCPAWIASMFQVASLVTVVDVLCSYDLSLNLIHHLVTNEMGTDEAVFEALSTT